MKNPVFVSLRLLYSKIYSNRMQVIVPKTIQSQEENRELSRFSRRRIDFSPYTTFLSVHTHTHNIWTRSLKAATIISRESHKKIVSCTFSLSITKRTFYIHIIYNISVFRRIATSYVVSRSLLTTVYGWDGYNGNNQPNGLHLIWQTLEGFFRSTFVIFCHFATEFGLR